MYNIDEAVKYHYDKFPPKKIDYAQFVNELVNASDSLARYDQMLKKMHNSEILIIPLRNQEAVLSSRMEGTISTMDEILQYEADEGEAINQTNSRLDVIETLLYQRALKNAQKALEDGYELSQGFIGQIHQQLLFYGRGASKSPGKFKNEQNYLADRIKKKIEFVPISPEKLTEGFDILFDFLKNNDAPSLIKTALMHLEFEALHPFKDGNGRIGRMLITLYLWKNNVISQPYFYISGYLEENKDEYIERMRDVSRNENWEEWIKFFLKAVEKQAQNNLKITEEIQSLYEEMKPVFSDVLSSKWSIVAQDFVFTNPIFRNSKFTKTTKIPIQTASKLIKKLVEEDILVVKEEASGRRSALFSFEPLMRIVRV